MAGGVVVADTGPLCYLVLIGCIDVLPGLFGGVSVPATVAGGLRHPGAPLLVRGWAARPPAWIVVHDDPIDAGSMGHLDAGERAAIGLAQMLGAGLLLVDDRAAATLARGRDFG